MKYTPETYRARVKALIERDHPNASPKRRDDFIDMVVARASWGLSEFDEADDILPHHISWVASQAPQLLLPLPSINDVANALATKEHERLKAAYPDDPSRHHVGGDWKLAQLHKVSAWDDEKKFAAVPEGAPKAASVPVAPAPVDDLAALDAEVARRFGKTWPNISATERRRFHEILKNEKRVSDNASVHDEAALARVGGDASKLNPIDRLSAFRAAQSAAAKNGA